jgi:hypothetical protein
MAQFEILDDAGQVANVVVASVEFVDQRYPGRYRELAESVPPMDWPALIAERRYRAETAGITVEGDQVDTGRDSQSLITGAALQAILDAAYTCRWKTASGFVDLTAQQILALAAAVRNHVQACFDREAELLGEVEAGTFTADLLEKGWPQ